MRRPPRLPWVHLAGVAVLVMGTVAAARLTASDAREAGGVGGAGEVGTTAARRLVPRVNPLTPTDPTRIPEAERDAVRRLGEAASTEPPAAGDGHSHAVIAEEPLTPGDQVRLDAELAEARAAALAMASPEQAEAAGYRTAAVAGVGVGTHYVRWSYVDRPFDPATPSMLLFDLRPGRRPQIVGLSYWVRSDTEPQGFAGPNDHWHQHTGLCIVNGWIDREQSDPPPSCTGTWLAGSDLWMLHAWVVPRWENRDGVFANLNQKLCPPEAGTPDIMRCQFFTGEGGN
jgi:hypothetical protein